MVHRPLALLVSAILAPLPAQDAPFRLVPRLHPAAEARGSGPSWFDSFAAAEAAARQRHTLLLLYFTAKW